MGELATVRCVATAELSAPVIPPAEQAFHINSYKGVLMTMSKRFSAFFFALFMLALAGCSSTPQQASTGQIIDDSLITTKVKAAIFEEPNLKSLQIGVETYKGIVQLSGFVNSSAASLKAADVTRKVEGVKGVKNSLVVK